MRLASLIYILCALVISAVAAHAETTVPEYDAAAFHKTTNYSIADSTRAFSPDGDKLLITSDATGVFNAYALDIKSGEQTALTHSATNATIAISYFPNDSRFLYTADQGGNELNHVYVAAPVSEPQDLTPGENVKAGFIGWINDGEAFILQTNERDSKVFDLYRYDADDYSREMIFQNDLALGGVTVSRDGAYAAGVKSRTSADNNLFLISLATDDEPQLITEHEGNISYTVYDFTPESDKLVFGTDEVGEFTQAWTYNLASGDKQTLIAEDWDVSYVVYSPSGRYRVSAINEDASTTVTIYDRKRKRTISLPKGLPPGDLRNVRFSPEEKTLAFLINADISPSNVFTVDLRRKRFNQLTQALNEAIDPDHLAPSEVVRYGSFDGLKIPGVLYKPLGASADNPAPALVWVHGGPGGQSRVGYSATIQHLVNQGYAVLAANNRGSSGYGKTFFHMDDKKHGDVDLKDIVYARAYLEGLDWVDGNRVGIIGGSYGGFMVMAALAFEPEAFDVGIDIFGVTNWVRTLKSIPPWWESFREYLYDEMGDPATDEERHRAISPLFHAENIVKPVLVIQGANDPRVLQVESDEMVAAIEANGVAVEYILFPDEGHGFRKRENRITASQAFVDFLDKYLLGDGPDASSAAGE
ncbi:MAG: S9 family peptidase [Parvularculaceae bacterium]